MLREGVNKISLVQVPVFNVWCQVALLRIVIPHNKHDCKRSRVMLNISHGTPSLRNCRDAFSISREQANCLLL